MSAAEGQYVTLGMGAEVFAVPASMVREILDYRVSFGIPDGPGYMLGLIDVRGRGTPLIDLCMTLDRSATEPAPRIGTRWRQDFIRGLAKRNGDFIVVPNLPRIFATCGQSTGLASTTQH